VSSPEQLLAPPGPPLLASSTLSRFFIVHELSAWTISKRDPGWKSASKQAVFLHQSHDLLVIDDAAFAMQLGSHAPVAMIGFACHISREKPFRISLSLTKAIS
jgi:hypothetical protein